MYHSINKCTSKISPQNVHHIFNFEESAVAETIVNAGMMMVIIIMMMMIMTLSPIYEINIILMFILGMRQQT